MAKRIYRVDQFHGGINSNSAHRDIDKDELVDAVDVDIDTVGQINMMESQADHTNNSSLGSLSHAVNPGYGMFHFKTDKEHDGTKGSTNWLAIADSTNYEIDMVSVEDSGTVEYQAAEITLAATAGGAKDFQPTFYFADGALRVSANNINKQDKSHSSKWYGMIDRILFQGTDATLGRKTITADFYEELQKLEGPESQSVWNMSSADMVLGSSSSFSYSDGIAATPSGVYQNTTGALIRGGLGLDNTVSSYIEKAIVSVSVKAKKTGEGEQSGDYNFLVHVTAGEMDSSTTFVTANSQTISESGTALGSETYDIEVPINAQSHDGGGSNSTYEAKIWGVKIAYDSNQTSDEVDAIFIIKNGITFIQRTTGDDAWDMPTYTQTVRNSVFLGAKFQTDDGSHDGSEGAYGWDKTWNMGVSFLYDDFGPLQQESLITQMGNSARPDLKAVGPQNFGVGEDRAPTMYLGIRWRDDGDSIWNKRITGARIYMKTEDDREWHPQATCNFVDGTISSASTGRKQKAKFVNEDSGMASGVSGWIFHLDRRNLLTPHLIDTYRSMTGYDDEQDFINPNYGSSVVVGRTVYIGNLRVKGAKGKDLVLPDTMLKCVPNRFDTFPSKRKVDVAIRDGESIVTLMEFADRVLQFKESTLFIINVSGDSEFLEDVHHFKGVKHPGSVCKTAFGIFWVNEFGAYLYDGRNITDLTEPKGMRKIKQTTWATFITGNSTVCYIPKRKQVIVVSDADAAGQHEIYVYNFTTQGWVRGVNRIGSGDITNMVIDWNGDPCWSSGSDLKSWDLSTEKSLKTALTTRDIDFGEPGVTKKVTKVLLTYKTGIGDAFTQTGNTVDGDATVVVGSNPGTGAFNIGMAVSGTGIPTGATILSIASQQFELSVNATATNNGETLTFTNQGHSNMVINYAINGITDAYSGTFLDTSHNYAAATGLVQSTNWTVAELLPSSTIDANKIYSMQLKLSVRSSIPVSYTPSGFAINDISLIYRPKPITNAVIVQLVPD